MSLSFTALTFLKSTVFPYLFIPEHSTFSVNHTLLITELHCLTGCWREIYGHISSLIFPENWVPGSWQESGQWGEGGVREGWVLLTHWLRAPTLSPSMPHCSVLESPWLGHWLTPSLGQKVGCGGFCGVEGSLLHVMGPEKESWCLLSWPRPVWSPFLPPAFPLPPKPLRSQLSVFLSFT